MKRQYASSAGAEVGGTVRPEMAASRALVPGDGLLYPIPLIALAVLVQNDHGWKYAFHDWLTGKLSDIAGMVFFPLLLEAIGEIACALFNRSWGPSRRTIVVASLVTCAVFTLVKTWAPANDLARSGAAVMLRPGELAWAALRGSPAPRMRRRALARDPSDLLALPALLLAIGVARGREKSSRASSTHNLSRDKPQ